MMKLHRIVQKNYRSQQQKASWVYDRSTIPAHAVRLTNNCLNYKRFINSAHVALIMLIFPDDVYSFKFWPNDDPYYNNLWFTGDHMNSCAILRNTCTCPVLQVWVALGLASSNYISFQYMAQCNYFQNCIVIIYPNCCIVLPTLE